MKVSGVELSFRPQRRHENADVRKVIDEAFGDPIVGVLVDDLKRGDAWIEGLSFVADIDDTVVGHVMFTRSILDAPKRLVDVLVLSPLSVLPEHQRHGVGTALAAYGLQQVAATINPVLDVVQRSRASRTPGHRPRCLSSSPRTTSA